MPSARRPARAVAAAGSLLAVASLTACPSQGGPPAVESVTIDGGDRVLAEGTSVELAVLVTPVGAAADLRWFSDDPEVASVEGSGAIASLTALAVGETTVTVESVADPSLGDSIAVEVLEPGSVLWTRQFGTDAVDGCESVAASADGTVVLTGHTYSSLEGVHLGQRDVFIRVYEPDGSLRWGRQFGTAANDTGNAAAVLADGSMVVAGWTAGALGASSAGGTDAFARLYDPDGTAVWTRQFGTSDTDVARSVAVDGDGNVVVAGYTQGSLEGTSAGIVDAFVRKYDADGVVVWTRQFGSSANDTVNGVAVDADGNVYAGGWTSGDLATGGGETGASDAFVRKYDAAGDHLWTRQFGDSDLNFAYGVVIDPDGNVLVAGLTAGVLGDANVGSVDAFLRGYGPGGDHLWTWQFGSDGDDGAYGVAVDGPGNAVVVGFSYGTVAGASAGGEDAIVSKLAPDGTRPWTRQFGTSSDERAGSVGIDGMGRVFVCGSTAGVIAGIGFGVEDAYVRAFGP